MHAFQGRTVDNVIAAMEANHPNLTTANRIDGRFHGPGHEEACQARTVWIDIMLNCT